MSRDHNRPHGVRRSAYDMHPLITRANNDNRQRGGLVSPASLVHAQTLADQRMVVDFTPEQTYTMLQHQLSHYRRQLADLIEDAQVYDSSSRYMAEVNRIKLQITTTTAMLYSLVQRSPTLQAAKCQ